MTVSLHKLTAGDGYTYLTRQVAVSDGTERGYTSLGDYYAAKGESPGRWWGRGLESLGTGGAVTEQQMLNLFGQGIHPDAERISAGAVRRRAPPCRRRSPRRGWAGRSPCTRARKEWRTRLGERFGAWNQVHGHPHDYPVPADERTRIRTEVAREMFTEQHGRDPLHPGELSGFVAQQSRPDSLGGRRVRPDVLPGEVGVHPVGGRPAGDVRADRGRARRRGHQDAGVPADGGRVHQGRRPRGRAGRHPRPGRRPVHPPGLPGR